MELGAITVSNHITEISQNSFGTLSTSWLSVQSNKMITITSNKFESEQNNILWANENTQCTFTKNFITKTGEYSLISTYKKCLIQDITFDESCSCGIEWFRLATQNHSRDQSKCKVSIIDQICFWKSHVYIKEYCEMNCNGTESISWSNCGTKKNIMYISLGIICVAILMGLYAFKIWMKKRKNREEIPPENYDTSTALPNPRQPPNIVIPNAYFKQFQSNISLQAGELSVPPSPHNVNILPQRPVIDLGTVKFNNSVTQRIQLKSIKAETENYEQPTTENDYFNDNDIYDN